MLNPLDRWIAGCLNLIIKVVYGDFWNGSRWLLDTGSEKFEPVDAVFWVQAYFLARLAW